MSALPRRFFFLPEQPPGQVGGNSYTDLMIRAWEHAGYVRTPMPRCRKQIFEGIKERGRTIGVANWIDNSLVSGEGKIRPSGLWAYLKTVVKLKILCKKLVFIRHNVYPHKAEGKSRSLARRLVDLSEILAFDEVFVHSSHYRGRSRKYLPHPAYEFVEARPAGPPSDDLIYFGNFARYKKLEMLISTWDSPSKLIIAGGCRDVGYLDSLKTLARGKNIEFVADWLGDDEAMRLVCSCAAMIIPHSGAEMIISGSLYFGLSCGVPVVCNRSVHARQLASEGVPGVIPIEDLAEINRLDIASLMAVDRREIEASTRSRCGIEKIASVIREAL